MEASTNSVLTLSEVTRRGNTPGNTEALESTSNLDISGLTDSGSTKTVNNVVTAC